MKYTAAGIVEKYAAIAGKSYFALNRNKSDICVDESLRNHVSQKCPSIPAAIKNPMSKSDGFVLIVLRKAKTELSCLAKVR